jgi:hypothetical protein
VPPLARPPLPGPAPTPRHSFPALAEQDLPAEPLPEKAGHFLGKLALKSEQVRVSIFERSALELQPAGGVDESDADSQYLPRLLHASSNQGADPERPADAVG